MWLMSERRSAQSDRDFLPDRTDRSDFQYLPTMPLPALQQLLRTSPTTAQLANRAVIYVSGSQSSEFLNGLLATVVPNVGRGPSYSAVLHAQVGSAVSSGVVDSNNVTMIGQDFTRHFCLPEEK